MNSAGRVSFDHAFGAIAKAVYEVGHRFSCAVVNSDVETFVGHVHDQVLTHDCEANEADIVI